MSQQLQITGGAKVRDLQDVIIGTSGVLSSLAFNVANGVPKLDVNGKILVSQLPNSVMEYQGTWNAATNTPTLVNGTGNQGDVYLCNVAGTTNFGAGPITFAVGDSAIYSGTIWQRAGGATGTVTSVGLTSTGNDAITITGSPITTSGNINLGFAGTNLQYINGTGDLTTFPTLISSIGLSMPTAFSVSNSPLTANGTIAVTGAGYPSQYIRGDGTLADFPTSGGGGSSVSYYLNGGTSQGTIGGVTYYEMSKTADTGTGVDFNKTGDGFIVAFLTDAGDPAQLNIPAGNWNYEIYASMSANGGTPEMYAELYKYDGTTFTLIATSPHEILYDGTALNLYTFAMTVPSTNLAITDRLAIKLYATNSGGKTTTVHTQDSHLCQIITTFSTGITALNGLTAQVQYFGTGTSGTDFNISSVTATHTFNLPVASAANTGKLSSSDWSTFNGKVPYTGATANVDLGLQSLYAYDINSKGNGTNNANIFIKQGILALLNQAGYSNILATGTKIGFFVSTSISTGYYADLQFSSLTAQRTYTLPDASGTLALLSADQTFTGINSFDYGINYKTGASLANVSGYISQAYAKSGTGAGSTLSLKISDGNSVKAINLDFVGSPATYTYTFPAASGTISLLESTQTFSGVNTFSALTSFTFSSGTRMDYGPYLTKGSVPTVFSGTTTNIYSDATTNNIVIRDNSSSAKLLFDNSTQTFTFPAATGTIALTSNIPTVSGTTNYHAKFTGTSTIGNSLIWDNGTNVGIGNTNTSYTLDVSGTGRFTGAITGAAASFSGNVGVGIASGTTLSGLTLFQVGSNASLTATTSGVGSFYFGNNAFLNTSGSWQRINTGFASDYYQENGKHAWRTIGSGSAGSTFAYNQVMTLDASGNLGIGITPSAWTTSNDVRAIQLKAGTFWNYSDFSTYFGLNYYWDGSVRKYIISDYASEYQQISGEHRWFSAPSGTAGATATFTERMRIGENGNIGIGVTNSSVTRLLVKGENTSSSNFAFVATNSAATNLLVVRNDKAIFAQGVYDFTSSGGTAVYVDTSGNLYRFTSSLRYKRDVVDYTKGLNELLKIKPKFYKSKNSKEGEKIFAGLIAEQIDEIGLNEFVEYNDEGQPDAVHYSAMTALLVKAIQEQQIQIQNLQEQINAK